MAPLSLHHFPRSWPGLVSMSEQASQTRTEPGRVPDPSSFMVLHVHRNHKAYSGRANGGGRRGREEGREIIYLSLHCHHQNDSCIKMGSDGIHFNVSLVVRDKVSHTSASTKHNLFEEKGQPKRNRAETVLLTSLTRHR